MPEISAKNVAALRKATGAGMMDCKKALEETGADMEAAKLWLREKGLAGAAKRAGREANEGAVEVSYEGDVGVIVELNCETDFVAKGAVFKDALIKLVARVRAEGDADLGSKVIDGETVDDFVKGKSGTLGEKMSLGRVVRFETAGGLLDGYKHVQNERGTIGVLVELGGVDPANAQARAVAHDIALHIANKSTAPRYVSRDEFPADVVETERQFHEKQTREEGKPEAAWPKIIDGKMTGFFKGTGGALLEQAFVKDNKQTISALLATLGSDATVRRFARVEIGAD
ncbi:MAG TPA: translation elongation factor Ts [Acidimicrobiia bacterium]|nr:translation elongation factor Ts [Acidimicrobiia bacterium]